jgi:hypothetical protein
MAMDDIYRLVQAVLIDGRMTRPTRCNSKNQPVGEWVEAEVLDATVTGIHGNGFFNGYVRFVIKGEKYAQDSTFHNLWLQGWTTVETRTDYKAAVAAQRKKAKYRRRVGR